MGAVDDNTHVVTTIHDCQLLERDIDPGLMPEHDVPVDIIVTPTQVRGFRVQRSSWRVLLRGSFRWGVRVTSWLAPTRGFRVLCVMQVEQKDSGVS